MLDQFDLEEEDELIADESDGAVNQPPAPPALPEDLLGGLGDGLQADMLRVAYEQAYFQDQVDEKLRANASVIIKLQQLQWERLRAHEQEVSKDPLFRETEKYLAADEREAELGKFFACWAIAQS